MRALRSRVFGRLSAMGICLVAGVPAAVSADDPKDCIAIESAQERLACYDAALGYGRDSAPGRIRESGSPGADSDDADLAVARAGAPASRPAPAAEPDRADFGLSKSRTDREGESLVARVESVARTGYDKLQIELDNGQVWKQVERERFPVTAGQTIEVRHGAFGSYKLYVRGRSRWTRVKRIR